MAVKSITPLHQRDLPSPGKHGSSLDFMKNKVCTVVLRLYTMALFILLVGLGLQEVLTVVCSDLTLPRMSGQSWQGLPTAQACTFVVKGKLYVAGGKTDPPRKCQRGLVPSMHVEVYDEENNQWCSVPQPHIPLNNYGAVEIEGRIFFILGSFAYDSGIRIGDDEVYHVDIEDWEPICHHDADAVFVYMPVNRAEAGEKKHVSIILVVIL